MFSLFCQEIYIVSSNVFSTLSIVYYQEFFMIRNFVFRSFVHQEFSALGTMLLRNFVIRNFVIRTFVRQEFCDQEFCDQELCTCTHAKHAKQKCVCIGLSNCFLQLSKRQKFISYQRIACQAHHVLHYHQEILD